MMYYGLSLNGGNLAGNLLKNRVSLNGFDKVLRNTTTKFCLMEKHFFKVNFAFEQNVYPGFTLTKREQKI